MILRPYGIVIDGVLELGLELIIEDGAIQEIRPHTGLPELFVVSPAFVNAHSHLEYRGLQGVIQEPDYPGWIREITRLKQAQTAEQVRGDCHLAAKENRVTGIGAIYEHSDRPFAGEAMNAAGLEGCIAQEVITFFEHETPQDKIRLVEANATKNREGLRGGPKSPSTPAPDHLTTRACPVFLNPHAYQTVDRDTLRWLGKLGTPLSIHAAETPFENQLTRSGRGPIADFYKANNIPLPATGKSVIVSLDHLGLVRKDTQLVHCCSLEGGDLQLISQRGASVAHCPRSNSHLKCPPARVRRMLDVGITVGLGLDSAASSGPIDMFAEMRAALDTSALIGEPLTSEEVWGMATVCGAETLNQAGADLGSWRIKQGSSVPLIKIRLQAALSTEDLILEGSPDRVEWL